MQDARSKNASKQPTSSESTVAGFQTKGKTNSRARSSPATDVRAVTDVLYADKITGNSIQL